ncbi:MAG TPA: iron-containing alcohol dehydrogenase, partial [Kofleriaceae bacterium]|nr:iron-containing alcohol dehydrogenase [Kofleriaceae bacterium]
YGITGDGAKKTGVDERVRARLVIYDPEATVALPVRVSVASLWNAMAHCVQALWTPGIDPAAQVAAEEGLRRLAASVLAVRARPDDVAVRAEALAGAYLGGVAADAAGTGLQHRLAHVLGGMLGMDHADTHAAVLPHVVRFAQAAAAPEAVRRIARALGAADAARGLAALAAASGAPRDLGALGLARDKVEAVVEALVASPVQSPRALDRASARALLEAAMGGAATAGAAVVLRAPESVGGVGGFGGSHESEAVAGALPRRQNAPRNCPLGLHIELLSGTPFTMRRAENTRLWMYRVQPSSTHEPARPLHHPTFCAPCEIAEPTRVRWKPLPLPGDAVAARDFLDGLVTLGGHGDPGAGPAWAVHLYAARGSMTARALRDSDGDVLIVPQEGVLEIQTECGWMRVAPGSIAVIPRGLTYAVHVPDGGARGWMLTVSGARLKLPERGPIGSNGLADARHFVAPAAAYEERACPGYQIVTRMDGRLWATEQDRSPFDVVAWHGEHVPYTYDLMLFSALGSVTFDHPDPSIHTVMTAPLDDHGRAIADFVCFRGRWDVIEHSLRPPFHHRNAASEVNGVVKVASVDSGYEPGCTFLSPLLAPHGITSSVYDKVLDLPDEIADRPTRMSDDSLWIMFESALPFRLTRWAKETETLDATFGDLFGPVRRRFAPP